MESHLVNYTYINSTIKCMCMCKGMPTCIARLLAQFTTPAIRTIAHETRLVFWIIETAGIPAGV